MNLDFFLKNTAKVIEPKIKEILNQYLDKRFKKLVNYQIETGGKRIRPALAILSCFACGGKIKDVLYLAAGLEILHNYSLIVDDIIDKSELRRGKPSCWRKFGKSITECVGWNFGVSVFQAVEKGRKSNEIFDIFAKISKEISQGEILDILFEQKGREGEPFVVENRYLKIRENDYVLMVRKKTASLISASCLIGGICAGATKEELRALKNFGLNLGVAFQLQDDILDICGKKSELGKIIGQDIKERKGGNILILLASKENKKILTILRKEKITKREVKRVISIIQKTKAQEKAKKLQEKYINRAEKNLNILPQNKWRDLLDEFLDFSLVRNR